MASSGSGMKYRKKPVVVVAEQFDPERPVEEWPDGVELAPWTVLYKNRPAVVKGRLRTLEGYVDLRPGDWIVTGIKGEKYPVRDDIFRETYEPEDKWIETVAVPLGTSLWWFSTSCPFCRRVQVVPSAVCQHYRRVTDIDGGSRIPYMDGIILSSKNDPLGEGKAAAGALADIVEEARQVRAAQEQERIRTGDDMAKLTLERKAEICERIGMKMETVTVTAGDWHMDQKSDATATVKIIIDRWEGGRRRRTILQGGDWYNLLGMDDETATNMTEVVSMHPDKTRKLLKWLRKKGLV